MDPLTITTASFTVTGPGATPVSGAVFYSNTTAFFTPDSVLDPNTTYTATITSGAADLSFNALVVPAPGTPPNPWTFTTAGD
jgi:hypothetical protein